MAMNKEPETTAKQSEPTLPELEAVTREVQLGHGETRTDPRKQHGKDKRRKHGDTR
jgi:hypothetical protein